MKGTLLVLLPPGTLSVKDEVRRRLEPFRLNEDDEASIRSRHWDYWHAGPSFPEGDPVLVEDLPPDYCSSGVLTPDNVWHDLQDHGWRLIDGQPPNNILAQKRWHLRFLHLLCLHPAHLCFEALVHS